MPVEGLAELKDHLTTCPARQYRPTIITSSTTTKVFSSVEPVNLPPAGRSKVTDLWRLRLGRDNNNNTSTFSSPTSVPELPARKIFTSECIAEVEGEPKALHNPNPLPEPTLDGNQLETEGVEAETEGAEAETEGVALPQPPIFRSKARQLYEECANVMAKTFPRLETPPKTFCEPYSSCHYVYCQPQAIHSNLGDSDALRWPMGTLSEQLLFASVSNFQLSDKCVAALLMLLHHSNFRIEHLPPDIEHWKRKISALPKIPI
jgi:hypothetical protein